MGNEKLGKGRRSVCLYRIQPLLTHHANIKLCSNIPYVLSAELHTLGDKGDVKWFDSVV